MLVPYKQATAQMLRVGLPIVVVIAAAAKLLVVADRTDYQDVIAAVAAVPVAAAAAGNNALKQLPAHAYPAVHRITTINNRVD